MTEAFLEDLDQFAVRFSACQLASSEWTHRAHLAIGAWYIDRFGPDEALRRLRSEISRLNESFGNRNTATDGYHETITVAYLHLIADFLRRCPANMPVVERVVLMLR